MARKLASVQKIKAIAPIEGADAIEKIEVLGWELVAKKGDFKVGDLCVYVEIDSILPDRPEFEFMRPRKFRVKTIKRGDIRSTQQRIRTLDVGSTSTHTTNTLLKLAGSDANFSTSPIHLRRMLLNESSEVQS